MCRKTLPTSLAVFGHLCKRHGVIDDLIPAAVATTVKVSQVTILPKITVFC
jgi:hypothetical protein